MVETISKGGNGFQAYGASETYDEAHYRFESTIRAVLPAGDSSSD